MLKFTTESGKVIKMNLADAYNEGGVEAAIEMVAVARMAVGGENFIKVDYVED